MLVVNSFMLESDIYTSFIYSNYAFCPSCFRNVFPYQHIDVGASFCLVMLFPPRLSLMQYRSESLSTKCPCDRLVQ